MASVIAAEIRPVISKLDDLLKEIGPLHPHYLPLIDLREHLIMHSFEVNVGPRQ